MSDLVDNNHTEASNNAESEWEYEYASDEFEDHYVMIDIPKSSKNTENTSVHPIFSLYVPPKPAKPKRVGTEQTPRKSKRRKRNADANDPADSPNLFNDDSEQIDQDQDGGNNSDAVRTRNVDTKIKERLDSLTEEDKLFPQSSDPETDGRSIQILNLHTKQPLISFNGQIYACHWATTLGTDMFFVKKSEGGDERHALRSFGNWDLLGLSGTRLIATEAHLVHKKPIDAETAPAAPEIADEGPQGSFLRRFIDLKVRKGELSVDATQVDPSLTADVDGSAESSRLSQDEALSIMFSGPLASRGNRKAMRRRFGEGSTAAETLAGVQPVEDDASRRDSNTF